MSAAGVYFERWESELPLDENKRRYMLCARALGSGGFGPELLAEFYRGDDEGLGRHEEYVRRGIPTPTRSGLTWDDADVDTRRAKPENGTVEHTLAVVKGIEAERSGRGGSIRKRARSADERYESQARGWEELTERQGDAL